MATFKICVFPHQQRKDGKYPVSIRVYWKGQSSYIGTEYYVTDRQLTVKRYNDNGKKKVVVALKDVFILNELNRRISGYESMKVQKLGRRIEMYSAKELAEYFIDASKQGSDTTINFVEFSRSYIDRLKAEGRGTTAGLLTRTLNSLIDFCGGRERIAISEITSKFLQQFEGHLRSPRTMQRRNQHGKLVTIKRRGVSDVTVIDYMTDIRVLFNAAMREYNDEDRDDIRIMHYPFRKYKMKRLPENEKRNLQPEQLAILRDATDETLLQNRAILARDVFMLSFYMVGANMVDLYNVTKYNAGRISYDRTKTKRRRKDRAYISIRVEPEALPLVEKYRDKSGERVFDFHRRYADSHGFSSNVNKGLKTVARVCGLTPDLSTYYARHTWATMARNRCGVSKDDIALSLNHVDNSLKLADTYIEKDFSRIDQANRLVIDYLAGL